MLMESIKTMDMNLILSPLQNEPLKTCEAKTEMDNVSVQRHRIVRVGLDERHRGNFVP